MKLLVLGCKTLREGVLVSVIFLIGGLAIVLAAQHVVPDWLHLDLVMLLMGFVLLLLSPIVLVSTFLLSVLPGIDRDSDQCEH
jgi:hypothetical protein